MSNPVEPDFTIDEVSRYFNVSKTTIHKLINTGHLRAYKLGRATRITRESVDKARRQIREAQS